jgi:hypothetical protein
MSPSERRLSRLIFAIFGVAVVVGLIACTSDPAPAENPARGLRYALAEVKGTYVWRGDLKRYHYSEKPRLEKLISAQPREHAVSALVECLDNTSPSRSSLDGKPIALRIVCYEALTQLVYYEPTTLDGDVAANWPGNISPSASPIEMRSAKQAWKEVLEKKAYIFQ